MSKKKVIFLFLFIILFLIYVSKSLIISIHAQTPTPSPRNKTYSAVIVAEENREIVVDYTYSNNQEMSVAMHHKGFPRKYTDKKVYIPRFLKNVDYGSGPFNSAISVMNTGNQPTVVTMDFYNREGHKTLNLTQSLSPYGRLGIWAPSIANLPDNMEYSVIIESSTTPIVADSDIRNMLNRDGGQRGGGFEGIPQNRLTHHYHVPIILRNSYRANWESDITIQNPNNSRVSVSVKLVEAASNWTRACSYSLPAFGQKVIYFPNDSCFNPSDNASARMPENTWYTAEVYSHNRDWKIAVIHGHSSRTERRSLIENAADSFAIDSVLFVPRVYNKYSWAQWMSSFTVENVGQATVSAKVSYISYTDGLINSPNNACGNLNINPLKSVIVYAPSYQGTSCIPEDRPHSAVITTSNNNKVLTGVYRATTAISGDITKNRSFGAGLFTSKEADRVYFIPRFYFYSYQGESWQTGIVVQNTHQNNDTRFSIYILNDQGKVLVSKSRTLRPYQATQFYSATDFTELNVEPAGTSYPNIPPSIAPTLTPACQKKPQGDANCDGLINNSDFDIWKAFYLGEPVTPVPEIGADFNSDNKVDLIDFEIWRKNRVVLTQALHMTTQCGWCGRSCTIINIAQECPDVVPPAGKICVYNEITQSCEEKYGNIGNIY